MFGSPHKSQLQGNAPRRVRFAPEAHSPQREYADASVDTSDLLTHSSSELERPAFALVQGEFPTLRQPLFEQLRALSLEIPGNRRRPACVEPGPPEPRVTPGPPEAPAAAPTPIQIPFIRTADSPLITGDEEWFYVVTVGKVVGVFNDSDYRMYKFSTYRRARNYYYGEKQDRKLRVLRKGRDDDTIFGPIEDAAIDLEEASDGSDLSSSGKKRTKATQSSTLPTKPGNRSAFRFASGSSSMLHTSRNTTLKVDESGKSSRKQQRLTAKISKQSSSKETTPSRSNTPTFGANLNDLTTGHQDLPVPLDTASPSTPTTEAQKSSAKPKKRDRNYENWTTLRDWIPRKQAFLDELLRHDGLADSLDRQSCVSCSPTSPSMGMFKCTDCWDGPLLLCQDCLISKHANQPLHRIEKWNGKFFEKASLSGLGLRVQLGHGGGECERPLPGPSNFTVFHTTGVHKVNINYCDCRTVDRVGQLLRARWFPATHDRTHTVFTFDAIDQFQELTLQGKTTLYDYYHTLLRLSDNMKLGELPSRLNDFQKVVRFWRLLYMAKRAARGQDPAGIDETSEGELAQECPACPHPGKNLPDDWRDAGAQIFIYTLFLAMDANFKLKGKDRGITDLELAPGWAYCVNEHKYQEYISQFVDEKEHDAVVRASVRRTPGYNVTGAGLVICSHHGLVRPNGIGDLQKGEKYPNMDYIFFAAIMAIALLRIVITYDIACQWSKNLTSRMETLPADLKPSDDIEIDAAIPSWHINAHGSDCQVNFALMYREGNGRTCGDEIEGTWDHTNSLGTSVREMAPGARHETLNDHFSGYNFQKIIGLRKILLKKIKEAHKMRLKHLENHARFTSTFKEETIREWTADIEAWNADSRKPNPYEDKPSISLHLFNPKLMVQTDVTLQDVRLELSQQDAEDAKKGLVVASDISPSSCLVTGLELEETQRTLIQDQKSLGDKATAKERADFHDKLTSWNRRVQIWRDVQMKHIPCAAQLLPPEAATDPATTKLLLPSSLPQVFWTTIPKMVEMERKLRIAQCDDALADIRRQRRIISGLWMFKKLNVSGQGNKPNTRIRGIYNRMNAKTERLAERYRAAHHALSTIDVDPKASWRSRLQVLGPDDVKGPGKEDGESSGRHQPSWIWLVPTSASSEDIGQQDFNSSMRSEWARSRARKDRWCEEYLILQEEMRRVVAYLIWKAKWWESQSTLRAATLDSDSSVLSGVSAYAQKQGSLLRRLAEATVRLWSPPLATMGVVIDWETTSVPDTSILGANSSTSAAEDADEHSDNDEDDGDGDVALEIDTCVFELDEE
ncbi:hypothetical protein BKA70DRAFT_1227593 [Coprinopsis sp. MPI-PUGE-AT-0042]|nr:hypothetical protein BKA70DRAFT_1227593 [Coprinopsis sp. MPI-PUGE-AT-0042]